MGILFDLNMILESIDRMDNNDVVSFSQTAFEIMGKSTINGSYSEYKKAVGLVEKLKNNFDGCKTYFCEDCGYFDIFEEYSNCPACEAGNEVG